MSNQSGKIVLVLVLFFLLLGVAVYFFLPIFKKPNNSEQIVTYSPQPRVPSLEATTAGEMNDYYSKNLKISFKIPNNAKVEEKFTDILINLSSGTVQIRRVGTNFIDINSYFNSLKENNKLNLLTEESKKVNSFDSILITMKDPNDQLKILKEYSIYVDNWVFKLATSDEALYPVLDQIVQSFQYKP